MKIRRASLRLAGTSVLAGISAGPSAGAVVDAGPTDDRRVTCAGVPATVVGTAGIDDLQGTPSPDVVVAGRGDDTVETGSGRDLVCLGRGFDRLRLEGGADRVLGGAGDDTLHGDAQFFDSPHPVRVNLRRGRATGDGNDSLVDIEGVVGSSYSDVIIGDAAGNGLFGHDGDDLIRAGDSGRLARGTADMLSGDRGNDVLLGGAGQDVVTYTRIPVPVTVHLASGVSTGQGIDRLAGAEAVQDSVRNDTLTGGPAGDLLAGSLGDDVIDGAGGSDSVIYRDVIGGVEVRLGSGTGHGNAAGHDTLIRVESVWGTSAADDQRGDDGRNHILAFDGDDRLVGLAGVDVLDGSDGIDSCEDAPDELVNCEDRGSRPSDGERGDYWSTWVHP